MTFESKLEQSTTVCQARTKLESKLEPSTTFESKLVSPKMELEPKVNPLEPKVNPLEPNANPLEPKVNPDPDPNTNPHPNLGKSPSHITTIIMHNPSCWLWAIGSPFILTELSQSWWKSLRRSVLGGCRHNHSGLTSSNDTPATPFTTVCCTKAEDNLGVLFVLLEMMLHGCDVIYVRRWNNCQVKMPGIMRLAWESLRLVGELSTTFSVTNSRLPIQSQIIKKYQS